MTLNQIVVVSTQNVSRLSCCLHKKAVVEVTHIDNLTVANDPVLIVEAVELNRRNVDGIVVASIGNAAMKQRTQ